jgi:transcription antitermination factor NusG
MALLPKEPDVFPDDLFALATDAFPWTVAHVRSRQEKALARYLRQRSIPFYLPQVELTKKRAGRTFTSFLPLFRGYVFVRGQVAAREAVWRSNLAVSLIPVVDQKQLGQQLEELRRLQFAGASLRPYEEFVAGDPVVVKEGAFRGYSGIVVREKNHDRLLISISLLKQTICVEFERELLRRSHAGERSRGVRTTMRRAGRN